MLGLAQYASGNTVCMIEIFRRVIGTRQEQTQRYITHTTLQTQNLPLALFLLKAAKNLKEECAMIDSG